MSTQPESKSTYFVTTPIYYVNGLPHVGSALTTLCCDVLARYNRLRGNPVWFLTGTDENATKVQEAAEAANIPTQEFVDGLASAFKDCWDALHIQPDDFIRTTEPRHIKVVQTFFQRLQERGYIYSDTYEGWYSVSDETFFRDSEVKDGVAIESGKPVIRVKEVNYFFKLSAFGQPLLDYIAANPTFLQPEFRKNEVIAFIRDGLRDMSITRANRGWGIPVPGEPDKVIYVWFDAVINYLTATGWDENPDWQKLWSPDLHLMGKEIFVRFHATLWPAMLMALDLPLPRQVYAHGWWTVEGGKKGGKTGPPLPHPTRLSQLIAERSGAALELAVDAQRYLLCREMNFGLDTEFTVENLLRRYNTDLANDLGNLLNRTVNMLGKFLDSEVPTVESHPAEFVALAQRVCKEYESALAENRFNVALDAVWQLVGRMNKFIDEAAPWALAKQATAGDEESRLKLNQTLYSCLEATRVAAILVAPFMPVAADAILRQLGLDKSLKETKFEDVAWGGLPSGIKVPPPQPLFPRIADTTADLATLHWLASSRKTTEGDKETTTSEAKSDVTETTEPTQQTPETPEAEPFIGIDDFMKVQLRVGEVLAAEPVPNATKLLRLTVQMGEDETRTILSGIAEYYQPDELIGRQIVVVANLQPRKMRGIESQGMLLAADMDGRAVLVRPDEVVPLGSRVR